MPATISTDLLAGNRDTRPVLHAATAGDALPVNEDAASHGARRRAGRRRTRWNFLPVDKYRERLVQQVHDDIGGDAHRERRQGEGMDISQRLSLGMFFTAFFVMLGPVKLISPFAHLTASLDIGAARRLALKGVGIACAGGLAAAVLGQRALVTWGVSRATLLLAAGIVLFVVALHATVAPYAPAAEQPVASLPPHPALSPLAVPLILTPYGVATFILILAVTHDPERQALVFGLFLVVMLLNLGAMWHARSILRWGGGVLALVGAVLGVLQVALALQLILEALGLLRVLPGSLTTAGGDLITAVTR